MAKDETGHVGVDPSGLRYVAQRLGLIAIFACLLFSSAGTWVWARGWAYLASVFGLEVLTLTLLGVLAPATLNQRGTAGVGVKPFDRIFAALWLVFAIVTPVIAGLDAVRFRWSTLSWPWFHVGFVAVVLASLLADWAMVVNEHFEQFVRIQDERGHRVVTDGPYRFVRHPGYLGAIVAALTTPLMLASLWTFVPAILVTALFVVRTRLEDDTLKAELAGYDEYARRTRFRLVPWVW